MFSEIEKEYKRGSRQNRFALYYWPGATLVVVAAIVLTLVFSAERWLVYGCAVTLFLLLVVVFFAWELHDAKKNFHNVRESRGIFAKISAYHAAERKYRIEVLVNDLARHGIRTQDDLKVTLDYFQSKLPGDSKPNLPGWILTAVITLSSVALVAYDDSIGGVNLRRFFPIFGSAIVVALIILTPLIIAKVISIRISSSHNKVDLNLVEDLAYIYIHFEEYKERLG